jgi:hypothetical protein
MVDRAESNITHPQKVHLVAPPSQQQFAKHLSINQNVFKGALSGKIVNFCYP